MSSVEPPSTPVSTATAKSRLARLSVPELQAGLDEARRQENLEAFTQIRAELESRVVTRSSSRQTASMPRNAPGATLPASANTPYLVAEVLKTTTTADLRAMLGNEKDTSRQMLLYNEIKKRERN